MDVDTNRHLDMTRQWNTYDNLTQCANAWLPVINVCLEVSITVKRGTVQ